MRDNNHEEIFEYLRTNWFEMVKPTEYNERNSRKRKNSEENLNETEEIINPDESDEENGPSEKQIHALKLYVLNCSAWDARRMNLLSVVLLILCSSIDCLAKLWVNYLCLNYESMENVFSIIFASIIVCMSLPLLIDLSFLLAHRVHPRALSQLIRNEIKVF